ncbi:MAG: JAB domain-containing protein [Clostridiales bacterium]|jgi:DNA repair protein RadC|nr:JAB domain-containing protein [Clostridiales bacterium]OPZ67622.1 MAG: hypothetical protein BWY81_01221 [Firmicutes bacterium ADurb.Bin467]
MSASDARVKRVHAATRVFFERLCPGEGDVYARRLRSRFVAPAFAFESKPHMTEELGLSHANALLLSLIPGIARYVRLEQFGKRPHLGSLAVASDYLKALFLGHTVEHFYMLALDASGRLNACALLQKGTTDSAPFYIRHILSEALRTRAHALIISHNHPNNTLKPSGSDVDCTLKLISALAPMGVPLIDHIVIADSQAISLRETGMVMEDLWRAQAPREPLLIHWLNGSQC